MNAMKNDGGPAFPVQEQIDYPSCSVMNYYPGMSLRDYLAAKAMQVYLANRLDGDDHDIAVDAYCVADAMLAARGAT